jgi:hypothetical protein
MNSFSFQTKPILYPIHSPLSRGENRPSRLLSACPRRVAGAPSPRRKCRQAPLSWLSRPNIFSGPDISWKRAAGRFSRACAVAGRLPLEKRRACRNFLRAEKISFRAKKIHFARRIFRRLGSFSGSAGPETRKAGNQPSRKGFVMDSADRRSGEKSSGVKEVLYIIYRKMKYRGSGHGIVRNPCGKKEPAKRKICPFFGIAGEQ